MDYEIHVTVEDFPSYKQANEFADYAAKVGGKALLIELYNPRSKPNVSSPLQLMYGVSGEFPNDDLARIYATDLSDVIRAAGYKVVRVKLESPLMPGEAVYYESHWKLDMRVDYEWQYAQLCTFLSKNPHYLRSKNLFDRGTYFLSSRSYRVKNTGTTAKRGSTSPASVTLFQWADTIL